MILLICGIGMGFVMAWILFTGKLWRTQDEAEYYKARARFYKNEAVKQYRARKEWEACEGSSNLFKPW